MLSQLLPHCSCDIAHYSPLTTHMITPSQLQTIYCPHPSTCWCTLLSLCASVSCLLPKNLPPLPEDVAHLPHALILISTHMIMVWVWIKTCYAPNIPPTTFAPSPSNGLESRAPSSVVYWVTPPHVSFYRIQTHFTHCISCEGIDRIGGNDILLHILIVLVPFSFTHNFEANMLDHPGQIPILIISQSFQVRVCIESWYLWHSVYNKQTM